MTNEYYTPQPDVVPGSRARSGDLNALDNGIAAAFDKLPSPDSLSAGTLNTAQDTGLVANAYVITLPKITSYTDLLSVKINTTRANTGAATININGIGAIAIKRLDNTDLEANDIQANAPVALTYVQATNRFMMPNLVASEIKQAATSATNAAASAAAAAASAVAADTSADEAAASATSIVRNGSGGVPGLTGFLLDLFNAAGNIKSAIASVATAARTWTFPNKSGTVALTSDVALSNMIINGCMRVDQRNSGALVSITAPQQAYTLDRWFAPNVRASGTITVQQDTADVPDGVSHCLKVTNLNATAVVATDFVSILQVVEGTNSGHLAWGRANGKPVVLAFKVKVSSAGTYAVSIRNGSTANRAFVSHFVLAANIWTDVFISIPPETSGTWSSATDAALTVAFDLGIGSNFGTSTVGSWVSGVNGAGSNTAFKLCTVANATFRLAAVRLVPGTGEVPMDIRSYGQELALCQRYYEPLGTGTGYGASSTVAQLTFSYKVAKRNLATASVVALNVLNVTDGGATYTQSALWVSNFFITSSGITLNANNFTSLPRFALVTQNNNDVLALVNEL